MSEKIDGVDAENALRLLDDEAMIGEALEESAKVFYVFHVISAGDQNIVEVEEHIAKTLCDTVHKALEGLCHAFQSKWHMKEFP